MNSVGYTTSLAPNDNDTPNGTMKKLLIVMSRTFGAANSFALVSKQTSATGATAVQLPSVAAFRLYGNNATGTSLTFTRHGLSGSPTVVVASGANVDLPCSANASEWDVVRTDVSNTQVTLNVFAYNTI